jgi:hypothetical protein
MNISPLYRGLQLGLGVLVVLGVGLGFMFWHRAGSTPPPASTPAVERPLTPTPSLPWFVDVAQQSGITFRHFDPATPMHYMQETLGSGLGWIDYNNDGWLDLFVVQDGPLRSGPATASLSTNKLYRNNGDGTFTDVTEEAGLARSSFGLGCAVGDFDNDGWDDLIVTYQGGMVLYHNEPDGKGGRHFVDVTAKAGLNNNPHLATSCAWGDIDGDGLLDLYVCNYVEVDLDHYPECIDTKTGLRLSCSPNLFPHVTHRLYRNNGNGTFTDISEQSGIASVSPAPGLAVLIADLDGDGRPDIYVANDLRPAYLFHNQGGGRFIEKAVLSGCGLDSSGSAIAGMGIDAGDLDGSGRLSLFVTNFQNRPNMLYLNQGGLRFQEASMPSGLGAPSLFRLKFGTVFIDADLDGNLDIAVANGHIQRNAEQIHGVPTAQEGQLFLGDGRGKFREVSLQAGAYFRQRFLGRGLAWADYDNDGRPDLAFSHNGGPVALLHNETQTSNHFLTLELKGDGKRSNRNAIGARVEIEYGGRTQVRFINGGGSYLSANDRRILAGLGSAERAERVTVTWPSGQKQEFRNLAAGHWYRLTEGVDQPEVVKLGSFSREPPASAPARAPGARG